MTYDCDPYNVTRDLQNTSFRWIDIFKKLEWKKKKIQKLESIARRLSDIWCKLGLHMLRTYQLVLAKGVIFVYMGKIYRPQERIWIKCLDYF